MVTKSKNQATSEKEKKKGLIKFGKLKLNQETVKDLSSKERKAVRGGANSAVCGKRGTGGADYL
jgi:natural product precursor